MNKRMPHILILIAILNQLHGQGGGQGYGDMVIMGIPFTHIDSLLAESHDNWNFTYYNGTGANNQDYAFTLNVYDTLRLDISICDPITNFDSMLGVFRRTVNDTFVDSSLTCVYPDSGQGYSLIDCFAEDSHACTPAIGGEDQPPLTPDLKSVIYGYELTPDVNNWINLAFITGIGNNILGTAQINAAVIPSSGDFSVSVWFYTQLNDNLPTATILSQVGGAGTNFYIGRNDEDKLQITDDWDTGIDWSSIEGSTHRLTVTKSATDTKLYLDGALVAERGSAISNPAGQPFYIGVRGDGTSGHINGIFDKVAVWDVELSETAVADLYNNYLNATINVGNYESSGDLNGYWMFDEKTGLLADLSGNGNTLVTNFVVGGWYLSGYEPVTYYIVVDSYSSAGNNPPNRFRINVTHHVPPFITGFDLAEDNSYVDITFNKNTYTFEEPWEEGDHSLLIEDFEPSNFQANGGVANPPGIISIKNTDDGPLQGGELTVRLGLEPNPASGVETFEIKPSTSTSIYDGGGTPMADTTNTGEITLNGVAVTIINAILEDDNSYITITFNDTVYSDQATTDSLNINDFELIFNQNAGDGGTATNVTIDSLRSNNGGPLTGGVDIIRIYLSIIDPPPSGAEHILIKPKDNLSIYSKIGVAMPETSTSGEINLKDKLAPSITETNLEENNNVSFTSSERLYKTNLSEEIDEGNFLFVFDNSPTGSNAETLTINSVTTPDVASTVYLYTLNLNISPLPSGVETVYFYSNQTVAIYDSSGNELVDSTELVTLNDKLPP
ncbi:MAG TPA: LamG domain-containing protein, partial [Candidatus Marinimicrobia bacterium]|nr:LamG domain-containing protein [Candidatus Neomarinimicrobiota bacterium]